MEYNGKIVIAQDDFSYDKVSVGDYVDAAVVMDGMDSLPPAMMRTSCAQVGEPYSTRKDPDTGKFRSTYITFKCVQGNFSKGMWEYCGDCFLGENVQRGEKPSYVKGW